MSKLTGQGLADFVKTKLNKPYVYGAKGADGKFTQARLNTLAKSYPSMFTASYIAKAKKFIGQEATDCSGLISWYTGKLLGSSQMHSTASVRKPISDIKNAPIGAVVWRSGHVGVYIGNGEVIESRGIDYGVVKTKVTNRNFTHYLLFSYIDYDKVKAPVKKNKNPYTTPTKLIRIGQTSTDVLWLKYELNEAGFKLDPKNKYFGTVTQANVKTFQRSCKLKDDGIVGPLTIKALQAN